MHRNLPNQLTVLRLILAAAFFWVLNLYRYAGQTPDWLLLLAVAVFVMAAGTDAIDGYLARRWHVESTFGRIMDPFCDKVLVIGAFIYLAGPRFVDPITLESNTRLTMASGVYPWMVVVILARELLVTGIRGEMEGTGVKFGANIFGKLKMILQSLCIPAILVILWFDPKHYQPLTFIRDAIVYFTLTVTVLSGIPYLVRAAHAMKAKL